MCENPNDDDNISSIEVNREKLLKFQEWCVKNELNYSLLVAKFIDSCLENNLIVVEAVVNKNHNLDEKINSILHKSLKSIVHRIEELESRLYTQKNENTNFKNQDDLSFINTKQNSQRLPTEDVSKIIYLTRQQVWQKLKKTDYIKYAGYDTFLKAKSDEFVEYGIFFDYDNKRFYSIDDDTI